MKEQDAIAQIISELDSITANDVGVRTEGTDQEVDPPEIILETSAARLPAENGHTSFGGFVTDENDDKVGWEFHQYFQLTIDFLGREIDEADAYSLLETIQSHFASYEYNADWFDSETTEWEVGDVSPRSNPVIEPDWYEVGVPVRFKYVRKTTKMADEVAGVDTITDVPVTVTEDSDTLDDGEIIIETKD